MKNKFMPLWLFYLHLPVIVCMLSVLFIPMFGCSEMEPHYRFIYKSEKEGRNCDVLFKNQKKYCLISENSESLRASFVFQNNTQGILLIDTIKTHCGCTKVKYPRYAIRRNCKDSVIFTISFPHERTFASNTAVVYFHDLKPIVLEVIGKRCKKR